MSNIDDSASQETAPTPSQAPDPTGGSGQETPAEHATVDRYPDHLMDFPPGVTPEQAQRWQRFFDLREDILMDYSHQTARAYWADLQDIFEWAVERNKDILALTDRDLTQYRALLRRRKYSENTIRRRMVTWRKMAERIWQGG